MSKVQVVQMVYKINDTWHPMFVSWTISQWKLLHFKQNFSFEKNPKGNCLTQLVLPGKTILLPKLEKEEEGEQFNKEHVPLSAKTNFKIS